MGSDPSVLETRELVLRSAGYSVVSAVSVKEAVCLFKGGDYDVIVLCHSLTAKECERLTGAVRASGSRIPIVRVSDTALDGPLSFADASLDKTPAAFLRSIEDVLRSNRQLEAQRREA